MKTVGEVLKLSSGFLEERGIERPRRIAEELLSHVLHVKRMDLYLQFDKPVIEKELEKIRELLKRCGKREPLQYVLGAIEFHGCRIKIDPRVFIPRPETELLVELVLKRVQKGVLWDVCTGSGCIGIALKKARPEFSIALSDLSPDALFIAAENAKLNGVEAELLQGDLLAPFKDRKVDCIVCNPPYISQDEYDHLDPSVRNFEPKQALLAGERGTEFYERLSKELPPFLNPGAQIFFEIGAGQGEAVKKLFPQGEIFCDWANLPRFFYGQVGF